MSTQQPRRVRNLAGLAAAGAALGVLAQDPPTYRAEYSASFKGRDVGTSVFAVRADPDSAHLTYSSETRIKGLLRLASPKPIVDRSEFVVEGDRLVPTSFVHEDGSRKGEDNHSITFDWQARKARIVGEHGTIEVDVAPGTLDRGSLQVALMLDLSRGVEPRSYDVVDEDSLKTYGYEHTGTGSVDTGIGPIDVVTYTQRREGSSRYTTIDFAPSLGYVPVKIEQIRDGESQSVFLLESFER
jgi:hypothetical protein